MLRLRLVFVKNSCKETGEGRVIRVNVRVVTRLIQTLVPFSWVENPPQKLTIFGVQLVVGNF